MNIKYQTLCLTIKWNLVEDAAQLLDSIIPYLNNKPTYILNIYDICFDAIKENRPEILQLILIRFPKVLNSFVHPLKLYFLFNFKYIVNALFIDIYVCCS